MQDVTNRPAAMLKVGLLCIAVAALMWALQVQVIPLVIGGFGLIALVVGMVGWTVRD